MVQMTLKIDGMQCGMCESHVNDTLHAAFPLKKVSSSHSKGETVVLSEEPLDEEKLWEILDYARTQKEVEEENYILVKKDSQSVRVNLKDIIYIEAQKHYVNLFLISGECVTVKTGFSELLQSVQEKSKEFITTHRSYAVNIEKVVRIGRTECVLSDSSVIPVSRSFYKEVNEAFIKYHLGRE